MDINPQNRFEKIEPVLFKYLLEVLSVLSFHLMRISLKIQQTSHYGVSISNDSIVNSLYEKYKYLKNDIVNFDKKTSQRLAQYQSYELSVDKIQELKIIESDRQFIRILKILNTSQLQWQNLGLRSQNKFDFFIVIPSIMDLAEQYRLIELDANNDYFSRFFN